MSRITDPAIAVEKAEALVKENRLREAITIYSDWLQEVLHARGTRANRDRYKEAIAIAFNNRGHLKYLMVDFDGALKDYNSGLEYNPTLPCIYYNRGTIAYRMGYFENAVQDMTVATRLASDCVDFQVALQRCVDQLNRVGHVHNVGGLGANLDFNPSEHEVQEELHVEEDEAEDELEEVQQAKPVGKKHKKHQAPTPRKGAKEHELSASSEKLQTQKSDLKSNIPSKESQPGENPSEGRRSSRKSVESARTADAKSVAKQAKGSEKHPAKLTKEKEPKGSKTALV